MAGAGTHFHRLVKQYTAQDFTPHCECRAWVARMDQHPPAWTLTQVEPILQAMRREAARRSWWLRLAAHLPGVRMPLRWMLHEAVRRAERDLQPPEAKDAVVD